jgi:hypothetical protein
VPEFQTDGVGVATPEWRRQLENYLFDLNVAVRFALVILGQSKENLVSTTKGVALVDGPMQLAEKFGHAHDQALHLARLIRSAEIRQMCAIATCVEEAETA